MPLLHRSGVCALALMAGTAALQIEPAMVRNLAFADGDRRVTVGAVRVPLWSAAWAQSPETFSLENVSVTFDSATYEAKRIDLSGVTSPRAEVEALVSASSSAPLAERLARVNAKRIAIPELKVRQKIGPETQDITHKNIVLTDVVQGRIGQTTVETTGIERFDGKTGLSISYGRTTISDADLTAFVRLYETKAGDAPAPLTRIYGAFSIDGISRVDDGGVSIRVARLAGRDFMARPTKESWAGTTELFARLGAKAELTSDEQRQFLSMAADFLTAVDIGFVEATGIELEDPSSDKASTGRIGRLSYTGGAGGRPADARAEGFEVVDRDGHVRIGTISLTGFSLKPTLEALKSIDGNALRDLDPRTMRTLVPTIGTLRISGVDIDTLNDDRIAGKPERVKATLAEFELTAGKPVNAIPTDLRVGLQNLAIALPTDSQEDGIKDLLALGYRKLDLSFLLAASWNEPTGELALRQVSVEGQEMGGVSVSGLLGNVSKDVFDADTAVASVALADARAKSLELTIQNSGLFERVLDTTAKEEKTTPEALRRTYGTAAAVAIPAMLGNSEQAKTLSQAIARFIAKPGRLTISAQAKDPAGLGIADLMALTEPADALGKLDIAARVD